MPDRLQPHVEQAIRDDIDKELGLSNAFARRLLAEVERLREGIEDLAQLADNLGDRDMHKGLRELLD